MSEEKSTEFNFSKENVRKPKKEKKLGFNKLVILPFLVSVIGTLIILFLSGFLVNKYSFFNNLANLIYRRQNIEISKPTKPSTVGPTSVAVDLENFNNISTSVAEKILPSVVGIEIEFDMKTFWGQNARQTATGSGFIISKEGNILTNNHVVNPDMNGMITFGPGSDNKVHRITVTLHNDEKVDAELVGTDPLTDLAIIKINYKDLVPVEFGDSDQIKIGEFVMAVGRPLYFGNSVSVGIISGRDRDIKQGNSIFNAIQTDAAINAGNSGGPLVNAEGKVIGVAAIKGLGDGLGFAIPINQAESIAGKLTENKTIDRVELGIIGYDLDETFPGSIKEGVLINDVKPDSLAEKAGIYPQDIIVKINEKEIRSTNEINLLKDNLTKGDVMNIELIRSGKSENVQITMP